MSYYGIVFPEFWTGETGRLIRGAGKDAQLLALYLMSNRDANMLGLFRLFDDDVQHETGLSAEEVIEAYHGLIDARFCQLDLDTNFVWVLQMARFRLGLARGAALGAGDKRVTAINRLYQALAPNAFLAPFFDRNHEMLHLAERRVSPLEGASKGLVSPIEGASKGHRSPLQAPTKPVSVSVTGTGTEPGSASGTSRSSRKAQPVFKGTCFAVFEWQMRELTGMLAGHAETFDLFSFFVDLDQRCSAAAQVLPHRDQLWNWLQQQVLGECRRRGLAMTPTLTPVPELGKQSSRMLQIVNDAQALAGARHDVRGLLPGIRDAGDPAAGNGHGSGHDPRVLQRAQESTTRMRALSRGTAGADERVVPEDVTVGRGGDDL